MMTARLGSEVKTASALGPKSAPGRTPTRSTGSEAYLDCPDRLVCPSPLLLNGPTRRGGTSPSTHPRPFKCHLIAIWIAKGNGRARVRCPRHNFQPLKMATTGALLGLP